MRYTQEDIIQIKKGLLALSRKDTELPIASTPLSGTEELAFVQDGHNVKANIKDIVTQLFLLGIPDFLNVTDKYNESRISLLQAISLIPYKGRKIGQVITFLNETNDWVLYQFQGERINQWNNTTLWVDLIAKIAGISTVVPDEEDIHGVLETVGEDTKTVLKFKDKIYNQDDFSGLGRIYLRKNLTKTTDPITGGDRTLNLLTQQMLGKDNTIYQIQYDFSLNSQTLTVPSGVVLDFTYGGNFINGVLECTDTIIRIDNIDNLGVTLTGTYKIVSAITDDGSPYYNNISSSNGLGHVYLRNKKYLTQLDFNQSNTIYHIRYDYDLNDKAINIPENCTLEFEGGSLSNGTLKCNNVFLNGKIIIPISLTIDGTLTNNSFKESYFNIKASNNDNTKLLQFAINTINSIGGGTLEFSKGDFYISNIILLDNVVIKGIAKRISRLCAIKGTTGVLVTIGTLTKGGLNNISINGNQADSSDLLTGVLIGNSVDETGITTWATPLYECEIANFSNNGVECYKKHWVYTIDHCNIHSCGNIGLKISGTDNLYNNLWISGCKTGIYIDGSDNKLSNIKIDVCGLKTQDPDSVGFYAERSECNLLSNIEVQACYGNGFKFNNCNNWMLSNCISYGNGLIFNITKVQTTINFTFYNCKNMYGTLGCIEQLNIRRNLYDIVIQNSLSVRNYFTVNCNMGLKLGDNEGQDNSVIEITNKKSIIDKGIVTGGGIALFNMLPSMKFNKVRVITDYLNYKTIHGVSEATSSAKRLDIKLNNIFIKGHSYAIYFKYKSTNTIRAALQVLSPFEDIVGIDCATTNEYKSICKLLNYNKEDKDNISLTFGVTSTTPVEFTLKDIMVIDTTELLSLGYFKSSIIGLLDNSLYAINSNIHTQDILRNIINAGLNRTFSGGTNNKQLPETLEVGFKYYNTDINRPSYYSKDDTWLDSNGYPEGLHNADGTLRSKVTIVLGNSSSGGGGVI